MLITPTLLWLGLYLYLPRRVRFLPPFFVDLTESSPGVDGIAENARQAAPIPAQSLFWRKDVEHVWNVPKLGSEDTRKR